MNQNWWFMILDISTIRQFSESVYMSGVIVSQPQTLLTLRAIQNIPFYKAIVVITWRLTFIETAKEVFKRSILLRPHNPTRTLGFLDLNLLKVQDVTHPLLPPTQLPTNPLPFHPHRYPPTLSFPPHNIRMSLQNICCVQTSGVAYSLSSFLPLSFQFSYATKGTSIHS